MGNNPSDERGPDEEDVDLAVHGDRIGESERAHAVSSTSAATWATPYGGGRVPDSISETGKQDAARANAMGVEMLKHGQHAEAVRHFKAALAFEPNSVQVLNNIGLACAKMQDFAGAYEWYERAYKQDTGDAQTLFSLAWVERKRQRYAHARELFQKVLEMEPEHVKALYLLGDILKTRNDFDGALRHFDRLTRLDPSSVDGHISLAQCYEQTRQYSQAEKTFRHALQLAPHRTEITFFLGRVYYNAKQYKQAVSYLERVPDSDPRAFEARTYSAKAYRELEDHDRAIQVAERAAEFRPHPDVMHFLGEQCLRRGREGDQQLAAQWFRRALEEQPGHPGSLMELGQLMYRQCRWQEAETHFTRLCESDRNNVAAIRTLALVKYKLRKQDSCRRCCDEALRLEPLCADALWLLAELSRDASDDRWYLNLRVTPDVTVADICQTVAKGYLTRKQVKEALQWLGKVQTYSPSDVRVREAVNMLQRLGSSVNPQDVLDVLEERRGTRSSRQDHLPEADGTSSSSSRRVSDDRRRGSGERGAGYPDGAGSMSSLPLSGSPERSNGTRAADLMTQSPDAGPACNAEDLERLLRRAERAAARPMVGGGAGAGDGGQLWQEVLAAARGVLRRSPDDVLALRCAARALTFRNAFASRLSAREAREIYLQVATAQGNISAWKEAQQTLEGAVRDLADDVELWRKLLWVHEQQQDVKGQMQCHKRLVQLGGADATRRVSYAELLLLEGHVREAREQLDAALRQDPDNTQALVKMAASWRQEGNLDEARRVFEQVLALAPAHAEALEGAAYCHRKTNNLDQAVHLYQQCLKVKSTAEGPLYYLGDILYRQHRHAECQHYLQRLVETNCSADYKTGALYLLAKSHVSLDEYEEAEKHARAGLALKPNHPHFLFILALVKNRMADYDASIETLKLALQHCDQAESDQLRVEIHDWLAQAYERKQDYPAALAELEKSLQKDPSHVSSLITRGLVNIHMKQLVQADSDFRRALAMEKNHALGLVRLGYCKLLASEHTEATQLLQRALQQRCGTVALPKSVKGCARIYMALSFSGQQDTDAAFFQLAEARKSHRNFNAVCTGAKDVIVKGECESLVEQLRKIPDLDVNLSQAWQLVHLLAKELEVEFREPAPSAGAPGQAAVGKVKSLATGAGGTPASVLGHLAGNAAGAAAPPQDQERRAWGSPEEPQRERRAWGAPEEAVPATPERRSWSAAPASVAPAPEPPSPAPQSQGQEVLNGQKELSLDSHELIDFNDLTHNECLGTGGFGAVYRGYYQEREVAIKKLFCEDGGNVSPMQLDELEKEVAALRNLKHPRLVSFIGACLTPPNLCIITEFMPGGSLHHLLHKAKTVLQLSSQAKIGLHVCEGVSFLHCLTPQVVHRDLKSLNIILDMVYNAKICDFGLTQSMEKTHISLKEGGNGGSPRYMAPECYDCKGKITEKVDVWAMGCILIEAFGGPLPYDDCSNIQQIVAKVLIDKEVPYIPHHLPRGVRPIVEDCFYFDIKQRTTARDVYSRLRQLHLTKAGET